MFLEYLGSDTSFSIPQVIAGKTITTIESNAFEGASLESVNIPNSITTIEDSAFENCTALNSIEIPNSATRYKSYPENAGDSIQIQ